MIKVNLLPSYVIEFRNIKKILIVTLIVAVVGLVTVWKYGTDVLLQEQWYVSDLSRLSEYTQRIESYRDDSQSLATDAGKFTEWINAFTLTKYQDYTKSIADVFRSVGGAIAGRDLWYNELTIKDSSEFIADGSIRGSRRFLDYYFRMRDDGFTLTAAAIPFPATEQGTNSQIQQHRFQALVPLHVTGAVAPSMLPVPQLPSGGTNYNSLFTPVQGAADPAAAGGPGGPGGSPPDVIASPPPVLP